MSDLSYNPQPEMDPAPMAVDPAEPGPEPGPAAAAAPATQAPITQAGVDRLSAGINPPPAAVTPSVHQAIFGNLFAAVEHLASGLAHIGAMVPAAAGIGAVIAAARLRLTAAKTALAEAEATLGDLQKGDFPAALGDGEAAVHAAEGVVYPQPDHT